MTVFVKGFNEGLLDAICSEIEIVRPIATGDGGSADDDIALLACLLHDMRRRRIIAAGIEVDLDVFKPLLEHLSCSLQGNVAAVGAAP